VRWLKNWLSCHVTFQHLHSDAFVGEKPTPAHLLVEIQTYEALKAKHKERKKAAQQPAAEAKASSSAEVQRPIVPEVSSSKVMSEGAELEQHARLINQLRNRN